MAECCKSDHQCARSRGLYILSGVGLLIVVFCVLPMKFMSAGGQENATDSLRTSTSLTGDMHSRSQHKEKQDKKVGQIFNNSQTKMQYPSSTYRRETRSNVTENYTTTKYQGTKQVHASECQDMSNSVNTTATTTTTTTLTRNYTTVGNHTCSDVTVVFKGDSQLSKDVCHPGELAPAYTEHEVSCLNQVFFRQKNIIFTIAFSTHDKDVWVGGRTNEPIGSVVNTSNLHGRFCSTNNRDNCSRRHLIMGFIN